MKNALLVALCSLFLFAIQSTAQAQSACGGTVVPNPDCSNSDRNWSFLCCQDGWRVHGVVYTDIKDQDHIDGLGVVCRKAYSGDDEKLTGDIQRTHVTYKCNPGEIMNGIKYSDVLTNGGAKRDSMDFITVSCRNVKTGAVRWIDNPDSGNSRMPVEFTAEAGKHIVGLAYKELDKGSSDRADCAAIVTAPIKK